MNRFNLQAGAAVFFASALLPLCGRTQVTYASGLSSGAVVAGLVRDAAGIPQMGALVQVLLPDATLVGSAITDPHGRYKLVGLPSGIYQIRATAALFLPAVRSHLRMERGASAVVNLTLATALSTAQWLPASRRTEGDAVDDWTWTLRSSANRPILRLNDPETSTTGTVSISSSSSEHAAPTQQGRVTVTDGDGGFGRGGAHDVFLVTSNAEGSTSVLRADFSGPRSPYPVNPSADVSLGFQRAVGSGSLSRTVLSYSSHPELVGASAGVGMQGAVLRSAHRFEVGDALRVDAGSVIVDANMSGNTFAVEPFFRVAVRPVSDLQLAYSFTAARGTESIEDLDRVSAAVSIAMDRGGHPTLAKGHHQALAVATRLGHRGTLEVAAFRDVSESAIVDGSGTLNTADLSAGGLLSDPTTQSFRALVRDSHSSGWRVFVSEPLTPALALSGQITGGEALGIEDVPPQALAATLTSLRPKRAISATVTADGRILRSGTALHAGYRWQSSGTITAVDSFHAGQEGAYLSCILRQPIHIAHVLPNGVQAVVDVNNLLAQGYQPFLSQDGRTLYLAQTPRMLQAGLSFNF